MSKKQFQDLQVHFQAKSDPVTKAAIDLKFSASHFDKVTADFGLFKVAARGQIAAANSSADKIAKSKKYQVLCDHTAFVGVIKQKDKATGQMIEFGVEFGKSVAAVKEQPKVDLFDPF